MLNSARVAFVMSSSNKEKNKNYMWSEGE